MADGGTHTSSDGGSQVDMEVAIAALLRDLSKLDAVGVYGLGGTDSPPPLEEVLTDLTLRNYLATQDGRADAREWYRVFTPTLSELSSFRAILTTTPSAISLDDLEKASKAIRRAFDGLAVWLKSAPAVRAAS